jgi:hypothetical protein
MMSYRLFVEDIGRGKFSAMGIAEVRAKSPQAAIEKGFGPSKWNGKRIIALPHDRKDLWPDGQTGDVPEEALEYR